MAVPLATHVFLIAVPLLIIAGTVAFYLVSGRRGR
jgi:hypothetical protein